jgi:hypothetical protein
LPKHQAPFARGLIVTLVRKVVMLHEVSVAVKPRDSDCITNLDRRPDLLLEKVVGQMTSRGSSFPGWYLDFTPSVSRGLNFLQKLETEVQRVSTRADVTTSKLCAAATLKAKA